MITYHFGNKEELWRESVRDMFELLQKNVIEPVIADAEAPPQDRFRRLLRLYTRHSARHPEHARITVAETIAGGERLEWMVQEFVKSNHKATIGYLNDLMKNGVLARLPVPSLLYALAGMVQFPFMLQKEAQLAMGYDFMSDEAVDAHADTVLALLFPPAS